MKKVFLIVLAMLMVFSTQSAFAQDDIRVTIEGVQIEFDVPPQIVEGRTLVPMRKIFEALGAKVTWVQEAQMVIATYDTSILTMEIGKDSFTVTDVVTEETKVVTLDVTSRVIDGRTLVPVRAISESAGRKVEWDNATRTVVIGTLEAFAEEIN